MNVWRLNIKALLLVCGGWLIGASSAEAHVRNGQQQGIVALKPTVISRKAMDINTINAWLRNDGEFFSDHATSGPGFEWPKGRGVHAIFSSSMWIGARVRGRIRVATVGHFGSEHRPGKILEGGIPDDWTKPEYRYYSVKPLLDSPNEEDYRTWPWQDGAPFYDADGNGLYDPFVDRPAVMWAGLPIFPDLLMWAVYNDADPAAHNQRWGQSRPLGVEIRQTSFAFDRAGPLGQMIFLKFDVYNKGLDTLRDTYLSVWSDPDVGYHEDDGVAVDTTLKLAINYNVTASDVQYARIGMVPPAVGYVYFQGPSIPTGDPSDTARWNGNPLPRRRELGITGFNFYCNPGTGGCAPEYQDPSGFVQSYNVMRGLSPTGATWIDPTTGLPTTFVFTGDPVTGTGWLIGAVTGATDTRFTMSAGPFTMAPGDSQQVVIGVIVGHGSNNLNSITVLREYTLLAQTLYDNGFQMPRVPPVPQISSTWDGSKLLLRWEQEAESFAHRETTGIRGDWKFHGYEIFQLDDVARREGGRERRVTSFYRKGGYGPGDTLTYPDLYDSVTVGGATVWQPVWRGDKAGIQNHLVLLQDELKQKPFVEGWPYHFYIRSVAYSDWDRTMSGFRMLQSPIRVVTVVPRRPVAGTDYVANIGGVIPHNHWVSPDYFDDALRVEVVDPARLQTGRYRITFEGSGANVTAWNLFEIREDGTILDTISRANTNFSGDDFYPLVSNGVIPKVIRQPVGVRRATQRPAGWSFSGPLRWFTGHKGGAAFPMDADTAFVYPRLGVFTGDLSRLSADSLRRVEIRFSSTNTQKAYRYVERVRTSLPAQPPVHPEYVPYILNRGGGVVYQDYQRFPLGDPSKGVTVPFTVWEVDPLYRTERQLTIAILERNDTLYIERDGVRSFYGFGNVDGKWDPLHTRIVKDEDGRDITMNPSRASDEVLIIFADAYHEDPLPAYTGTPTTPLNLKAALPRLPAMYAVWLRKLFESSTWRDGEVITIRPNYGLSASKVFEFNVTPSIVGSPEIARQREDLKKIRVVPNPYYGTHKLQRHQLDTYVTFTNLPAECRIRIFNLAGEMVRIIDHTAGGQFDKSSTRWDLKNHREIPVASGMYIAHIEAPGIGDHVVKFAVFIQQERLERF